MRQDDDWRIFITGPLFEAVQALMLFTDSKTFPDMIRRRLDPDARVDLADILREFNAICLKRFARPVSELRNRLEGMVASGHEPLGFDQFKQLTGIGKGVIEFRSRLSDFVHKYFQGRHEAPVKGLPREPTRSMEAYIDGVWPLLSRDSRNLPRETFKGTLIRLDYPYVVAGGRFDEVYYWDAYFTGEGLVLSGHPDLFHCMVKNYAAFINDYGFVPNGNRRYYLTRSQPPFFYLMVDLLGRLKGREFLKTARFPSGEAKSVGYVEMVDREYQFWMGRTEVGDHRAVRMEDGAVLNRYWDHFHDDSLDPHVQPRPEAYHEDLGAFADTDKYKSEDASGFFRDIRAAAESGWDFSSRWFRPEANAGSGIRRVRSTIRTTEVLPIDLNALLFGMERKLHEWTGDPTYAAAADRRKRAILHWFWDEELGWFFDHCREVGSERRTDVWSLAGSYPLFTRLFDEDDEADMAKVNRMAATIRERFLKAGGVVTTLLETGEQWDYPNGWAPLQWVVVRGLLNYGRRDLALEIAKRFVGCVGRTYRREGRLMEKYNVCEPEVEAGGGEYAVQHGFGWTNGVVKAFMTEFRREMEADPALSGHLG